jgi:hypothetical protein
VPPADLLGASHGRRSLPCGAAHLAVRGRAIYRVFGADGDRGLWSAFGTRRHACTPARGSRERPSLYIIFSRHACTLRAGRVSARRCTRFLSSFVQLSSLFTTVFNTFCFAEQGWGGRNPLQNSPQPHSSVLVEGVRQRRSCALGWYRPSVGVPGNSNSSV